MQAQKPRRGDHPADLSQSFAAYESVGERGLIHIKQLES
jgi:hypothetical protein